MTKMKTMTTNPFCAALAALLAPVCAALAVPSRADVPVRPAAVDGAIRMVTANLRSVKGGDTEPSKTGDKWARRKELCRDVLAAQKADIYCFQECRMPHVKYFQETMPEFEYFARARVSGKGAPGNPIYYSKARFERLDGGGFWLSETPGEADSKSWGTTYARHANWVRLRERKTGRELIVLNTHLDHAVQSAREGQIQVVMDRAAALSGGLPMLLAGDFNAGASNPVYSRLAAAGWRDTYAATHGGNANPGRTFHGFKPLSPGGEKIDWILTRGPLTALRAEIIKDCLTAGGAHRYPSDHFFVSADVAFGGMKSN